MAGDAIDIKSENFGDHRCLVLANPLVDISTWLQRHLNLYKGTTDMDDDEEVLFKPALGSDLVNVFPVDWVIYPPA